MSWMMPENLSRLKLKSINESSNSLEKKLQIDKGQKH